MENGGCGKVILFMVLGVIAFILILAATGAIDWDTAAYLFESFNSGFNG